MQEVSSDIEEKSKAKDKKPYDPFKNLSLDPSAKQILLERHYQGVSTIKALDGQQRAGKPTPQAQENLKHNANAESPLSSLDANVLGLIVAHLSLRDSVSLSHSCFSIWNRYRTHRHLLIAKLAQVARQDPMVRYLLDALLFDSTYQTYPVNLAHILHVLNKARPMLDTLFKSDPNSAWKFFTLCISQPIVDQLLQDEMATTQDHQGLFVLDMIALSGDVEYFDWYIPGFDPPYSQALTDADFRLARLAALGGNDAFLENLADKHGYDLTITLKPPFQNKNLLTFAVMGGHKSTVRLLLEEGADPFIGDDIRLVAADYGHWELYEELPQMVYDTFEMTLLDPADNPRESQLLAKSAAKNRNLTLLLVLIEKHSFDPALFLLDVIEGGHSDIFWYFIEQKWLSLSARFNDGITLAHLLAQAGHLELLKTVLDNDDTQFQPTSTGESILHFPASRGQRETFDYLYRRYYLGRTFPVDNAGNSVGHFAARFGHAFFIKYLNSICPDVLLQKNQAGQTILHAAANHGDPELLIMIIEEIGIKIEERDSQGNTTLHILALRATENYRIWISIEKLTKKYGSDLLDISNNEEKPFTVREKIVELQAESYFPEESFPNEENLIY